MKKRWKNKKKTLKTRYRKIKKNVYKRLLQLGYVANCLPVVVGFSAVVCSTTKVEYINFEDVDEVGGLIFEPPGRRDTSESCVDPACMGVQTKPTCDTSPRCDYALFKVNCLHLKVNVVIEKDRTTVHDVFYVHYVAQKFMM